MSKNSVVMPYEYFPNFNKGGPLYNGKIFIGEVNTDPEVIANQKDVTYQDACSCVVESPIIQPIRTGSGGVPIYNNSPVRLYVNGSYSIKVLDKNNNLIYYTPNVTDDESINTEAILSLTLAEAIAKTDMEVGKTTVRISDRDYELFTYRSSLTPNECNIITTGTPGIFLDLNVTPKTNQVGFGVYGLGYPNNEGAKLNVYAQYCRDNSRELILNDLGGAFIIYTTETIDFQGIDVIGNRAGIYEFGSLPSDAYGFGLLTGIPSGRPPAASVYNDVNRKPKTGVCILSDTLLEIVHVDARRIHKNYGVTGWLETSNQHGIIHPFDASYKGTSFNWDGVFVSGCGGDAVVLPNGIELSTWENVRLFQNNGYGLTTAGGGGHDNQEYVEFKTCKFYMNRLDGVLIANFRKGIEFDTCGGNSNGWYGFGATYSVGKPADLSFVRGMVRVEGVSSGASIFTVKNCFSEDCARLVTMAINNPLRVVRIEDNYIFPTLSLSDLNNDILFTEDTGSGAGQVRDLKVIGNATQNDARGIVWRNEIPGSQLIDVRVNRYQTTDADLPSITIDQVVAETFREESTFEKHLLINGGLIGDGTAGTFISQYINDNLRLTGKGNNSHSTPTCYLVTANWGSTNADNGGAYLVFAFKTPAGNVIGESQVIGSGQGFTSAPTVALNGDLSVELDNFYRASITRIDMSGYRR